MLLRECEGQNIYQLAERLKWEPRMVATVARRLLKSGRVARTGKGIPGDPYCYQEKL